MPSGWNWRRGAGGPQARHSKYLHMNAYNLFHELTFDHRYGKIHNRNLPRWYKRELNSRIPIVPSPDHIHLFVIGGSAGQFPPSFPAGGICRRRCYAASRAADRPVLSASTGRAISERGSHQKLPHFRVSVRADGVRLDSAKGRSPVNFQIKTGGTGAGLTLRGQIMDEIAVFDPRGRVDAEQVELAPRAAALAGLRLEYPRQHEVERQPAAAQDRGAARRGSTASAR